MKRTIMCFALLTALTALLAGCSSGPNKSDGARKPETLTDEYDKKAMEKAIEQARATFDDFLKRIKNPQPGDKHFAVKVMIKDANGTEHFWVNDLKLDAEPYSGKIGNEPGIVKCVKLDQVYSFSRKDITDWMYMANGKMQGNYTLRPILDAMPKEEADAFRKKYGL